MDSEYLKCTLELIIFFFFLQCLCRKIITNLGKLMLSDTEQRNDNKQTIVDSNCCFRIENYVIHRVSFILHFI